MKLHEVTHPEYERDYIAGFEHVMRDLEGMDWASARDKFNLENPRDMKPSMRQYYFAKGGIDALLENM